MRNVDQPAGLGIVGCGNILAAYMTGLARAGQLVRVVRFADADSTRAEAASSTYGVGKPGTLPDLLADPEVDVVVNLTPPTVHDEVIRQASAAGRHIFTEKPLSATTLRAGTALEVVARHGISLACAPDTFLGPVHQTSRAVIDGGELGEIIGYTAFSTYRRVEERHPNPGFLFQPGGGPLLDLGPYYIAAFVNLFGPIASVSGRTRIGASVRRVTRPTGMFEIPVSVPTHASATLTHASGVVGTFVASFDIWDPHHLPDFEIYGENGTLESGHPAWYDGDVFVRLHRDDEWRLVPTVLPDIQPGRQRFPLTRGLGVLDLVESLSGRPCRTSSELGLHSLEVLEAIQHASDESRTVRISTTLDRPAPLTGADLTRWFG
jgi:predicted dehydrogenase